VRRARPAIVGIVAASAMHVGFVVYMLPASAPAAPSCRTDWKLCANNSELANNWKGYGLAQYACKRAANDSARYGTPEWPSASRPWPTSWLGNFHKFRPGTSMKNGRITLIEDEAKFQNGVPVFD
jgi:hypothetical protein